MAKVLQAQGGGLGLAIEAGKEFVGVGIPLQKNVGQLFPHLQGIVVSQSDQTGLLENATKFEGLVDCGPRLIQEEGQEVLQAGRTEIVQIGIKAVDGGVFLDQCRQGENAFLRIIELQAFPHPFEIDGQWAMNCGCLGLLLQFLLD